MHLGSSRAPLALFYKAGPSRSGCLQGFLERIFPSIYKIRAIIQCKNILISFLSHSCLLRVPAIFDKASFQKFKQFYSTFQYVLQKLKLQDQIDALFMPLHTSIRKGFQKEEEKIKTFAIRRGVEGGPACHNAFLKYCFQPYFTQKVWEVLSDNNLSLVDHSMIS